MLDLSGLRLSAEYQPLLNPHTYAIYGYEALSRFYSQDGLTIAPNIVFEELHAHQSLLYFVEKKAKSFQLKHAPKDAHLFVNIDPHAIEFNTDEMLTLLQQRDKISVEIIENTCINDAKLATHFIEKLIQAKIPVGLDDIGAPHSMLSIDLMNKVTCLKFDKYWLKTAKQAQYHHLLSALLSFARNTNKLTVLEGIETEDDLAFAQNIGVDLVQGFLFKPQFLQANEHIPLNDVSMKVD